MFTTVEEAIATIEKRRNPHHGLEHFKNYLETIHNPQQGLTCIHIAGTNGKGSTTNYLRAMLQKANMTVGTFTSPYLITHLDRIRINNENMDADIFLSLVNQYYDSFIEWDLGMFEIDMVLSLLYFQLKKVDIILYEVGLGGRLDATNVIAPLVSVITNIGLDHTALLGDTYEKIAFEKAGIIKDSIPLFTTETKESCLKVFESQCQKHHTFMYIVDDFHIECSNPIRFRYNNESYELKSHALYQVQNASLALAIIHYLRKTYRFAIEEKLIKEALEETEWQGRYEIMQEHPRVIIDGAHNPAGIKALCRSLKEEGNVAVLFSALKDKNFEKMIDLLECVSDDITITHFENTRSFDLQTLRKRATVTIIEDYQQALEAMLQKNKTIIITGSLYFISEIRKHFKK